MNSEFRSKAVSKQLQSSFKAVKIVAVKAVKVNSQIYRNATHWLRMRQFGKDRRPEKWQTGLGRRGNGMLLVTSCNFATCFRRDCVLRWYWLNFSMTCSSHLWAMWNEMIPAFDPSMHVTSALRHKNCHLLKCKDEAKKVKHKNAKPSKPLITLILLQGLFQGDC